MIILNLQWELVRAQNPLLECDRRLRIFSKDVIVISGYILPMGDLRLMSPSSFIALCLQSSTLGISMHSFRALFTQNLLHASGRFRCKIPHLTREMSRIS
jgi:hypothetical protein